MTISNSTSSSHSYNSQLIASSIKYWLLSNNYLLNTSKTTLLNTTTNSSITSNSPSVPSFYLDNILILTSKLILGVVSTMIYLFLAILLKFLKLLIIIYLESDILVNILLVPYVLFLLIHL